MYSNRSPPTVPAGMEFPYISISGRCGIVPSTGMSRLRRYSSIAKSVSGAAIRDFHTKLHASAQDRFTRKTILMSFWPLGWTVCRREIVYEYRQVKIGGEWMPLAHPLRIIHVEWARRTNSLVPTLNIDRSRQLALPLPSV